MLHAVEPGAVDSRGLSHLSRAFSSRFHARPRQVEGDDGGRSRLKIRFRGRDTFVRQSGTIQAPEQTRAAPVVAEPQQLFASSTSVKLKASSLTVVRQENGSKSTVVFQKDRLDLHLRLSQVAFASGDVQGISSALEGRTDVLERIFAAASLLGDFSGQLSNEFLSRIRSGLEVLTGENGLLVQAASLDLRIRVETKTVRIENTENGTVIERSVQRIDIRVRFVSLSVSGEAGEAQDPVEADLEGSHGHLRGLGLVKQFDFNGDGQFNFEDIAALADEIIDVTAG